MLDSTRILTLALKGDLDSIVDAARKDIAITSAKEQGGTTKSARTRKALVYIKAFAKIQHECAGADVQDGMQCFTNGYTGFLLSDHLPGLPESKKVMKLKPAIPLDTPDIICAADYLPKAKQLAAEWKASDIRPYLQIGSCYYDPRYFISVCDILGGTITMHQNNDKPLAPAVFRSENGTAILCPVRNEK